MQTFGIIGLSDAGRMMPNTGILASSKHVERFEHVSVIRFLFRLGHFGGRDKRRSFLPRGEVHFPQLLAEQRADIVESEIMLAGKQKAVEVFPDRLYR